MKEELQSKLVEILASIQTATGKASDFAIEQLPDIAQQYVLYGRVRSVIFVVAFTLIAGALLKYAHWAWKNPWNTSAWSMDRHLKRSESNLAAMVLGVICAGFFSFCALLSTNPLVWVAPKVWLLKEIAALVK